MREIQGDVEISLIVAHRTVGELVIVAGITEIVADFFKPIGHAVIVAIHDASQLAALHDEHFAGVAAQQAEGLLKAGGKAIPFTIFVAPDFTATGGEHEGVVRGEGHSTDFQGAIFGGFDGGEFVVLIRPGVCAHERSNSKDNDRNESESTNHLLSFTVMVMEKRTLGAASNLSTFSPFDFSKVPLSELMVSVGSSGVVKNTE